MLSAIKVGLNLNGKGYCTIDLFLRPHPFSIVCSCPTSITRHKELGITQKKGW
jgi:hypothetical protein